VEYTKKVLQHLQQPRNVGTLQDADGQARVGDPRCGDFINVWIKVQQDRIIDFKYKVFGCGAAIATTSVVSELAIGKSFYEAMQLCDDDVIQALDGLPEGKRHCSLLGIQGLHTAMADYLVRRNHQKETERWQLLEQAGFDIRDEIETLVRNWLERIDLSSTVLVLGTGHGELSLALARHRLSVVSVDASAELNHIAQLNAVYEGLDESISFQSWNSGQIDLAPIDSLASVGWIGQFEQPQNLLDGIKNQIQPGCHILMGDLNPDGHRVLSELLIREGERWTGTPQALQEIKDWMIHQHLTIESFNTPHITAYMATLSE
jgi:nitrogen fixation NifU-like protein